MNVAVRVSVAVAIPEIPILISSVFQSSTSDHLIARPLRRSKSTGYSLHYQITYYGLWAILHRFSCTTTAFRAIILNLLLLPVGIKGIGTTQLT